MHVNYVHGFQPVMVGIVWTLRGPFLRGCAGKNEESMDCELAEQCVIGSEQATNEANTDVLCETDTKQEGLQQEDMQLLLSPQQEQQEQHPVI